MKVYWASIEYKYINNTLKGGFVYVFIKARSQTDAYERIIEELNQMKLSISVLEFLRQYDESTKWQDAKETKHYLNLYNLANRNECCVFDTFYAYEHE